MINSFRRPPPGGAVHLHLYVFRSIIFIFLNIQSLSGVVDTRRADSDIVRLLAARWR